MSIKAKAENEDPFATVPTRKQIMSPFPRSKFIKTTALHIHTHVNIHTRTHAGILRTSLSSEEDTVFAARCTFDYMTKAFLLGRKRLLR